MLPAEPTLAAVRRLVSPPLPMAEALSGELELPRVLSHFSFFRKTLQVLKCGVSTEHAAYSAEVCTLGAVVLLLRRYTDRHDFTAGMLSPGERPAPHPYHDFCLVIPYPTRGSMWMT
jgi:hypothetical protein